MQSAQLSAISDQLRRTQLAQRTIEAKTHADGAQKLTADR
jgi:hypothetical protein